MRAARPPGAPRLRTLIRTFSIYFDLTNLAEQQAARPRQSAPHLAAGARASGREPRGSPGQLREHGVTARQLNDLLRRALICPVFTAHPSEARRRTILEKLVAIAGNWTAWSTAACCRASGKRAIASIAQAIETFWLSDTVRRGRPTVLDEVRQGLGMVESGIMDVVLRVYRELEAALERVYPDFWETRPMAAPEATVNPRRPLLRPWCGGSLPFSASAPGSAATATATRT